MAEKAVLYLDLDGTVRHGKNELGRDEDQQVARNADIDFQWAAEWRAQATEVPR